MPYQADRFPNNVLRADALIGVTAYGSNPTMRYRAMRSPLEACTMPSRTLTRTTSFHHIEMQKVYPESTIASSSLGGNMNQMASKYSMSGMGMPTQGGRPSNGCVIVASPNSMSAAMSSPMVPKTGLSRHDLDHRRSSKKIRTENGFLWTPPFDADVKENVRPFHRSTSRSKQGHYIPSDHLFSISKLLQTESKQQTQPAAYVPSDHQFSIVKLLQTESTQQTQPAAYIPSDHPFSIAKLLQTEPNASNANLTMNATLVSKTVKRLDYKQHCGDLGLRYATVNHRQR